MIKNSIHLQTLARVSLIAIAGLTVSACGGSDDPVVDNTDNTNNPPVASLAAIQGDIFTPSCTQCHSGQTPAASMSLEEGATFASVVDVQATNAPNVRVIPGNSAQSFIIRKLRGTDLTASEGQRMPRNGPPYLEDAQIDLIARWIDEGAADN